MEDEINLLDYWRTLLKWKKEILLLVSLIVTLSVIISLVLPKTYMAEATLMPLGGQQSGGLAAAAARIALGGFMGSIGDNSSGSAQFMAILRSRTLAERVIEKYDLMKIFYSHLWDEKEKRFKVDNPKKLPTMENVVKVLQTTVTITDSKNDLLIRIRAEYKDPKFAAKLANNYILELTDYLNENAFTVAKRNRIFIEAQLERNKTELLESGKELTAFYATNRISNVVATVDVNVSMAGPQALQAESKRDNDSKVEPHAKLPGIPNDLADIQQKTEFLQSQADQMKEEIQQAKVVRDVPQQVYLQYLLLRRELLGQVNALLTQQYEMAKIEETKEDLNFQVLDWAQVPELRFKPKRRQIVMVSFAMSLFLAVFYAFFREYLEKMKARGATTRQS